MEHPGRDVDIEIWCRRCRRVGSRPLTEAERAWAERLRAGHGRRVMLGLTVVPLGFAAGVGTAVFARPSDQVALMAISVWMVVVLMLGVPVSILLVRDHLRACRALRSDLEEGHAWLFEPAAQDTGAGSGVPPFALLPESRRIVDASARSLDTAREDVIESDARSAGGLYAPMSLIAKRAPGDMRFEQRALSGLERSELERIGRSLAVPTLSTFLALSGLIALVALLSNASPEWKKPDEWLSVACMTFICVRLLARYIRSLWVADRIRMDLRVGLVAHVTGRRQPPAEFLPFSKLLWRVQGAPAEWRDRRTAVSRLRNSL